MAMTIFKRKIYILGKMCVWVCVYKFIEKDMQEYKLNFITSGSVMY